MPDGTTPGIDESFLEFKDPKRGSIEIPPQTPEALQSLPIQVTWIGEEENTDIGLKSSGHTRPGVDSFEISLQGHSPDDVEQYSENSKVPVFLNGEIYSDKNGDSYLKVGTLTVESEFRHNQLGLRTSMAMARIAVERGCKRIELEFAHPASLKIIQKIFGDERIHFVTKDKDAKNLPLEITAQH